MEIPTAGIGATAKRAAPEPRRPYLSVVAPCYNEDEGLVELHRRVSAVCAGVVDESYEIVIVDDGSTDATALIIAELAKRDPHLVAVKLSRNYGHQLALTAGLSVCRGERILVIDADLQDPPELLDSMMALMDQGADVVYGQRTTRAGETWVKRATAALFYRVLAGLADIEIPLDTGDFRLMSRRAVDAFLTMPEQHRFVRGMVSWIGFKQVPLYYERVERLSGTTKYPLRKMLRLAADAITGFSVRPLRLANHFALMLAICSLLVLGYAIYRWFAGATVLGWTSVMTVLLLLGCCQMLVLAIMCEYLGRLFVEAKRRPLFLIDQIVRGEATDTGQFASAQTPEVDRALSTTRADSATREPLRGRRPVHRS